jgi:hypothetical protein
VSQSIISNPDDGLSAERGFRVPPPGGLDDGFGPEGEGAELAEGLEPAVDLRGLPADVNLADHLDEHVLSQLATEVIEGYEADVRSNEKNYRVLEKGLEMLGLEVKRLNVPFADAPGPESSLILRAVLRFNAGAMSELCPAQGPVRAKAMGDAQGIDGAAQRKQRFLNEYLLVRDRGYYPDRDKHFFLLGLLGSTFRVVEMDPVTRRPVSRGRTPFNFVVAANAVDLDRGGRYTLVDQSTPAMVKRLQVLGHYRAVDMSAPQPAADDSPGVDALQRAGKQQPSDRPEDAVHTILRQRVEWEIPGLEHLGDDGEPSGLPLPWFVTVDLESRTVLHVDRGWDPVDPNLLPLAPFSHEKYVPGPGFYGLGFAHILASPADAHTFLLRTGLIANYLASFPGGFRLRGTRLAQTNLQIGPGEFPEVDAGGANRIQDAIMPLPYRDVPASFVPLMQEIKADGESLGQIAETQVGEGRQDAPVGTTIALMERLVEVESAVIKRLHAACLAELQLLAKLFAAMPGEVYPFSVGGKTGVPIAPDFANADDIVPVSDPNIPTQTQRLTLAQGKLQLASSQPALYDMRQVHMDMLRTMGLDEADIQRLMPPVPQGQPADPVTEFQAVLKGAPLVAGPDQMHAAHIQAHLAQAQMPNLPPPVVQALVAHVGEHLGLAYRQQVQAELGVPLPPPGTPLPPQIEGAISVAVAQASDAISQKLAPLLTGAGAADPAKMAELASKAADREQKERDGARKAEQAARQDQGERIHDAMEFNARTDERALEREQMVHEDRLAGLEAAIELAAPRAAPRAGLV